MIKKSRPPNSILIKVILNILAKSSNVCDLRHRLIYMNCIYIHKYINDSKYPRRNEPQKQNQNRTELTIELFPLVHPANVELSKSEL